MVSKEFSIWVAVFTAETHILKPKSLDVMLFWVAPSIGIHLFLKATRALQVDLQSAE